MKKSSKSSGDQPLTEEVPSMESAAREAALADGVIASEGGAEKSKKINLRRGKWTTEEEEYANRLISEFKLGLLPLADGTTLRTFLSKLLNCDPMRISKKFVGQNCIGKQVFRRRQQDLDKLTAEQIDRSRKELAELERKFQERVFQTNRAMKLGKDAGSDEEQPSAVLPWIQDESVPTESIKSSSRSSNKASSTSTNIGISSTVPSSSSSSSGAAASATSDGVPLSNNGFNNASEGDYPSSSSMNPQIMYSNGYPMYYSHPYMVPGPMPPSNDTSGTSGGTFPRAHSFDLFYGGNSSEMGHFRSSFAYIGPDGLPANSSFGFSGQDWPSMGNLVNAGESMENIVQLMQQYQGQPLDAINIQDLQADPDSRRETDKDKVKLVEDIGYPLDELVPTQNSKSFGFQSYRPRSSDQDKKVVDSSQSQRPVENSNSQGPTAMMISSTHNRLSGIDSGSSITPGTTNMMPRNSSVENFWMLVNLGDLPRPEQGVLSETLWQSKNVTTGVKSVQATNSGLVDPLRGQNGTTTKRNQDDVNKVKTESNGSKKPKLDSLFSK